MTAAKVCVECFDIVPGLTRSRCDRCQPARNRELRAARPHHTSADYRRRSKAIRDNARNDPTVGCWLCGQRTPPEGYRAAWTADHETPGDKNSGLRPAHAGCNSARGNRTPAQLEADCTDRHADRYGLPVTADAGAQPSGCVN